MFPVDVGKHFPDLLLRQALGVECARKALALIFLVAQYGQYPGMEVAVPVTRNTECQCPPMTIGTTGTVPVTLVVTGNQEYIKIGNEATSKIATIVHQKR